jgi:hypothetical protein
VMVSDFAEVPIRTNSHSARAGDGAALGRNQLDLVLGLGQQEAIGFRKDVRGPEYVECLNAWEDEKGNGEHRQAIKRSKGRGEI